MKLLLEIVLSVILHPIAVVLMWINLLGRDDLNFPQKLIWAVSAVLWGLGPVLYITVGGGTLW
jgi:hypothetical protein